MTTAPPAFTSSEPVPVAELVGPVLRNLVRHDVATLQRWIGQVSGLGGCQDPIRLTGHRTVVDQATGEILHEFDTADQPHGQLMVRCNNRRASRCGPCSQTYQHDTFHLIRAGLLGGEKDVPEQVKEHPRDFATLTAPSFGPVHTRREKSGKVLPCRPRREGGTCEHGRPLWCAARHAEDDPQLGQAICEECYDYTGAVLWNAHTGALWRRFTTYLWTELAKAAGIPVRRIRDHLRISYAKVAEFQRRGLVHFHAVIRLDGPDGPHDPPPAWATHELLEHAIQAAAAAVHVRTPDIDGVGSRELVWGEQVDIRPIAAFGPGEAITEKAVAAYVAKYATKAAEATGTLDRRLRSHDLPSKLPVPDHTRRMIATCWTLGRHTELLDLKLRKWAHMLGFRGHFSTKSRTYSTTLGAIRSERAEYRAQRSRERLGLPGPDTTLVVAHWRYAGQGFTPGESMLAAAAVGQTAAEADTGIVLDAVNSLAAKEVPRGPR